MKTTQSNTHLTTPAAAGHTPGPKLTLREVPALDGSGATAHEIETDGHTVAHVYPDTGENFAALLASAPDLLAALDSIEATAVNLHCALQSTAHMDPADSRIPVITGQVVKDLLVMRAQARAAIARATGQGGQP